MTSTAPSSEPGDPVVDAADGTPSVTDTDRTPARRRRVAAVSLPLLLVVVLVWLASCTALSLTASKQPIGAGVGTGAGAADSGRSVSSDAFAAGFTITGEVAADIRPGVDAPIDIHVENPYAGALRVSGIRVEITGVAPGTGAGAPDSDAGASVGATPGTGVDGGHTSASGCSAADFTVVQSAAGLRVPEGETRSLSQLDVPVADWPRIAFASATRTPDACRDVTLSLAFHADGEVR